jgi:hypothetical protein
MVIPTYNRYQYHIIKKIFWVKEISNTIVEISKDSDINIETDVRGTKLKKIELIIKKILKNI